MAPGSRGPSQGRRGLPPLARLLSLLDAGHTDAQGLGNQEMLLPAPPPPREGVDPPHLSPQAGPLVPAQALCCVRPRTQGPQPRKRRPGPS